MRLLIAITSCRKYEENGNNKAVRETWLASARALCLDGRFFIGDTTLVTPADAIKLPVPDDYKSLPYKTRAMAKWALEKGFDFVYKCDRDTYVVPRRLLNSGFSAHDYHGHFPQHPEKGYMPHSVMSEADYLGHYVYA